MSSKVKTFNFINRGLVSSSGPTLRTALGGGYWKLEAEVDNTTEPEFVSLGDGSGVGSAGRELPENDIFSRVLTDWPLSTTSSARVSVPSYKVAVRLVGEADHIADDAEWRTIIAGGSYGTASYEGVFMPRSYDDTSFEIQMPYMPLYLKTYDYENYEDYEVFGLGYDYNHHISEFQNYIIDIDSELQIPSYYLLLNHKLGFEDQNSEAFNNLLSREGTESTEHILSIYSTQFPPVYDIDAADFELETGIFLDKIHNMVGYFTGSFITTPLSASTIQDVEYMGKNLFFNKTSQFRTFLESLQYKDRMPYYAKLSVPVTDTEGTFYTYISSSGFENIMLTYLKEYFVDKPQQATTITYENYVNGLYPVASSISEEHVVDGDFRFPQYTFKACNLYTMILDTFRNSAREREGDFCIVGGQDADRQKIINSIGRYRYCNTVAALNLLEKVNEHLTIDTPIPGLSLNPGNETQLEDLLNASQESRYSEILAYRIEKRKPYRAADTTDVATEEVPSGKVLQNFLISNANTLLRSNSNRDGFTIFDSQIKYGEQYTYSMFAYVLITGFSYGISDTVVSRQLATTASSDTADTTYCVEFYNPFRSNFPTRDRLVYTDGFSYSTPATSSYYTAAQLNSPYRYLADFNFSCEPLLQIVEVPLGGKALTVLDHPMQEIDLSPFQRMDASQTIGFLVNLESPQSLTFPTILTENDFDYRSKYLVSNDLIDTDKISDRCRSQPNRVQIYRKTTMPRSKTDFSEEDLIVEKDLILPNTSYSLTNCVHEERVQTNKEYYYLMRFISNNETIGHTTAVVKAQLVSDGGYIYSLFDQFTEQDLLEVYSDNIAPITPAIQFKKLMQIIPNIHQIALDDTDVDYTNSSYSEISNLKVGTMDESIFDKTFKIRLTSKKTGKKIDLNVTYKLN
tara:strand:+ start:4090 stop:6828 length:2739 start_codon:yes stop_codon:yes gene_type:complete